MYVKSLKLKNFRNYDECEVNFCDSYNLISGKNGQGKTNLVEAVMLLALSKSPRTTRDDDLKKENTTHAEAELRIVRNFGEMSLKCVIDDELKKKFYINGNEVKKVSEIFGNLVAVYFSPNDLVVVSGSPAERRDFMDTDISQLSGSYYSLTQRYTRVLDQRNKLLKIVKNKDILLPQIEVWDEQLATLAGAIIKTRKSFVEKLKGPANEIMQSLSKDADRLGISYVGVKGESSEEIKKEILSALKFNLERDMELGYTTVGPHRDDLKFELNGRDARIFASQGQQRSVVLALKLAELQVFENELGEKPILVLDDVFSELDTSRQRSLYEKFRGAQTMMTGTLFKFKPTSDFLSLTVKDATLKSKFNKKSQ